MSILEIHEFHEWGQVVLCTLSVWRKKATPDSIHSNSEGQEF